MADSSSKPCSPESDISFGALAANKDQFERSPILYNGHMYEGNRFSTGDQLSLKGEVDPMVNSYISFSNPKEDEMLTSDGNWDELRPMVDCVLNPSLLYSCM